jgi:hypothetical protein
MHGAAHRIERRSRSRVRTLQSERESADVTLRARQHGLARRRLCPKINAIVRPVPAPRTRTLQPRAYTHSSLQLES